MEDRLRGEPLRAIVDEERPERIALLGGRRFGEPVPVAAIARHPSQARRAPGVPRIVGRVRRDELAQIVELARYRRPVRP